MHSRRMHADDKSATNNTHGINLFLLLVPVSLQLQEESLTTIKYGHCSLISYLARMDLSLGLISAKRPSWWHSGFAPLVLG